MAITASEANSLSVLSQLSDGTLTAPYKWLSLQNNLLDGSYHPLPSDGSYQVGWWGATLSDSSGLVSTNPVLTFTFSALNIGLLMVYGDNQLNEYPVDFDYVVKNGSGTVLDSGSITGNAQVGCLVYLHQLCTAATTVTITVKRINKINTVPKLLEIAVGSMIVTTDTITPNIEETLCSASFTRATGAYNTDGSYVAAGPRLISGKFGKGILIEEATTNLVPNGSFESWSSGLPVSWGKGSNATVTQVAGLAGGSAVRLSATIGGNVDGTNRLVCNIGLVANTQYTISYTARRVSGTGSLAIAIDNTGYPLVQFTDTSGNFVRVTGTITTGASTSSAINFLPTVAGDIFEIDQVQVEQKVYATTYMDATRNADALTIPTNGVLNGQQGTIEVDVYVNTNIRDLTSNRYIFASAVSNVSPYNNSIALCHNTANLWDAWITDANGIQTVISVSDTLSVGWHCFAVRWSAASFDLFIDGVKQATKTNPSLPPVFGSTLALGQWQWPYGWINTYMDDLRISDIARSDTDILNGVNSNAALPIDQYTSAKMNFDSNLDVVAGNVGWTTATLASTETITPRTDDATYANTNTFSSTDVVLPRVDDMHVLKSFASGDIATPRIDDVTGSVANQLTSTEILTPRTDDATVMVTNNLTDTEILTPKVSDYLDTSFAGRNWLQKTSGFNDLTNWSLSMGSGQTGGIALVDDAIKGKVIHATKTNSVSWWVLENLYANYWPQKFDPTKQYTISFDVRSLGGTTMSVAFMDGNGTNMVLNNTSLGNIPTSWTRVSYTFTPLIAGNSTLLYITGNIDEYWLTNFKLEIGSSATAWTPAPEDGWNRISNALSTTETLTPRIDDLDLMITNSLSSTEIVTPRVDDITYGITNQLSDTEILTPRIDDMYAMITNKLNSTDIVLPKICDLYYMLTNSFTKADTLLPSILERMMDMTNIHSVMNADSRQVFGKVEILYTDPLLDGTITVTTPDNNNIGSTDQLYDGKTTPEYHWFSLANNKLDGTYHCPDSDSTTGWWGATLSNADGTFNTPQVVSVSFLSRPVDKIVVVGDSQDNNYPVDFDVILYQPGNVAAYTQTVRGNTQVNYTQAISPVGNIVRMDLKIYKISKQSVCKILEFFSLINITYMDDDIADIHLLEELAYEDSGIPLGAISSNEIDISLVNKDRMFDLSNVNSPLYNALRKNRRVTVSLGAKVVDDIEWHQLGVFWTTSWKAPFSDVNAALVARDKLELLRSDTFTTSQLYTNYTLYQLYDLLFSSYGLTSGTDYQIDTTLQSYTLPYAWFDRMTYREALAQLSKCAFVHVYCDHNGVIIVKVPGTTTIRTTTYTMDDNIMDFDFPMSSTNITNSVEVLVNALLQDTQTSIYSNTDGIAVPANTTQDITCIYNSIPNVNVQAPTIVKDTGLNVLNTTTYVWGTVITVQNTTGVSKNITSVDIQGSPLKTTGTNSVIVEEAISVQTEGRSRVTVDNPFIQTQDYANYLANTLINVFANQTADISMECRGDIAVGVGEDINITTNYATDVPYTVVRQDIEWDGALGVQVECKKF